MRVFADKVVQISEGEILAKRRYHGVRFGSRIVLCSGTEPLHALRDASHRGRRALGAFCDRFGSPRRNEQTFDRMRLWAF